MGGREGVIQWKNSHHIKAGAQWIASSFLFSSRLFFRFYNRVIVFSSIPRNHNEIKSQNEEKTTDKRKGKQHHDEHSPNFLLIVTLSNPFHQICIHCFVLLIIIHIPSLCNTFSVTFLHFLVLYSDRARCSAHFKFHPNYIHFAYLTLFSFLLISFFFFHLLFHSLPLLLIFMLKKKIFVFLYTHPIIVMVPSNRSLCLNYFSKGVEYLIATKISNGNSSKIFAIFVPWLHRAAVEMN